MAVSNNYTYKYTTVVLVVSMIARNQRANQKNMTIFIVATSSMYEDLWHYI